MSELNMRRLEMDLIGGHRNPVYETVADILKDRERLQRIEQCAREVLVRGDVTVIEYRREFEAGELPDIDELEEALASLREALESK